MTYIRLPSLSDSFVACGQYLSGKIGRAVQWGSEFIDEEFEIAKDFFEETVQLGREAIAEKCEAGKASLKGAVQLGREIIAEEVEAGKASLKKSVQSGREFIAEKLEVGKASLKKAVHFDDKVIPYFERQKAAFASLRWVARRFPRGILFSAVVVPSAVNAVGTTVGSAYPGLPVGFYIGEKVATRLYPEMIIEEHTEQDIPKKELRALNKKGYDVIPRNEEGDDVQVVTKKRSRSWKVTCVVTTLIAAGTLTWVFSRLTGQLSSFDANVAYLIGSTATSILGGLQVQRLMNQTVDPTYVRRSLQFAAAQQITKSLLNYPLPMSIRSFSIVSGPIGLAGSIAGMVGWYAEEVERVYNPPKKSDLHHQFVEQALTVIWGGIPQFSQAMAENVIPKMLGPLVLTVRSHLELALSNRSISNAMARTFNEYMALIETHPEVAQAKTLLQLEKAIRDGLKQNSNFLGGLTQDILNRNEALEVAVDNIIENIPQWEKMLLGFPLRKPDPTDTAIRKLHLKLYLSYVLQKGVFSSEAVADLTPEESRTLRSNLLALLGGIYWSTRSVDFAPLQAPDEFVHVKKLKTSEPGSVKASEPGSVEASEPRSVFAIQQTSSRTQRSLSYLFLPFALLFRSIFFPLRFFF